jgi:hypothetical protein
VSKKILKYKKMVANQGIRESILSLGMLPLGIIPDTHLNDRKCYACNKEYSSRKDLRRHLNSSIHRGYDDLPHKCLPYWGCEIGSRGFARFDHFRRHVLSVHDLREEDFTIMFPR